MDALVQVRPASIPRWNEHKDVKEDKERDPCVFGPHGRNLAVDSKVSKFQTQKSAKEKKEIMISSLTLRISFICSTFQFGIVSKN